MKYFGIIFTLLVLIGCTKSELDTAIEAKDINKVKAILMTNTGVSTDNMGMDSLLHLTVSTENTAIAKFFIEMGADVKVKEYINSNEFNISVLHTACLKDNFSMVKMLVEKGAEIDAVDGKGRTPLFDACAVGDVDIVKYLFEHGASLIYREPVKGTYPIHEACYWDNADVVKYLLNIGMNKNLKDFAGQTPFKYAVEGENLDIIKMIVDSGAEIDNKGADGESIFHGIENIEVVRYLVSIGLDPWMKNKHGLTALDIAVEAGNDDVAEYLKSLKSADTVK
ncbi:MAG: ankyrin repeat domain-containing protein [Brevinematales bacterium]|nr:ankyrin repeat domain-containing protein [Brevinematales bacterium]